MVSAELTGATPGRSTDLPPRESQALFKQGFDSDGLFALRSAVAAHTATLADQSTVDTMVLVAHELASNAVRHGGGTGRLRLWLSGGALHCEVSDAGPGLPDPELAGRTLPAPALPGGRGLWLVRNMADLRIVSSPKGTTVTATVQL
jgi:anti-sigma regulatory factor (Ser/Thr protein kinase)